MTEEDEQRNKEFLSVLSKCYSFLTVDSQINVVNCRKMIFYLFVVQIAHYMIVLLS